MGYMSWTACDTAVDFCARLRFLRGLTSPASPAGVFALPSKQQLEGTKQMKPTFTITKKNEPLIKNFDPWFVFHFG